MFATDADGQKEPAAQGFAVGAVEPVARQKPAAHVTHAADAVALAYEPSGQMTAALAPAGQK